jgi:flagellar hook assembly protein FlgD
VNADGTEVRSAPATVRITAAAALLAQSSPHPFRSLTRIEYTLPETTDIELNVYDVRGRLVARLDRGVRAAGVHIVNWDGRDNAGNRVSAGTYFYKLSAPDVTLTRKMVIVR